MGSKVRKWQFEIAFPMQLRHFSPRYSNDPQLNFFIRMNSPVDMPHSSAYAYSATSKYIGTNTDKRF
jgi:hypothetical protein